MSSKTLFEVTEERFFERVVTVQDLVGDFDTIEEVANNLLLVDKKTLIQFTKHGPKLVDFSELTEDVQQVILEDHLDKL